MQNILLLGSVVVTDAMRNAAHGNYEDLFWLISKDAEPYLEAAKIDRREILKWLTHGLLFGFPKMPIHTPDADVGEQELREFGKRKWKRHAKWRRDFKWQEHYGKPPSPEWATPTLKFIWGDRKIQDKLNEKARRKRERERGEIS